MALLFDTGVCRATGGHLDADPACHPGGGGREFDGVRCRDGWRDLVPLAKRLSC